MSAKTQGQKLSKYAEMGEDYVKLIRRMIRSTFSGGVKQKGGCMTMKRTLTNAVTCAALLWLVGEAITVQASEQMNSYPHMIVCEVKGVRHFAYLDRVEADGRALYITPSGKTGTVAKDGVMERTGVIVGNCAGKTLKELVASGQAHFIQN